MDLIAANQRLKARLRRRVRDDVAATLGQPEIFPLLVIDEHIRRTGSVRTVDQVIETAVQQQRSTVGVEKYRRKSVVMMIDDERAPGRLQQRIGQGTGRHVGIEHHQREPRGLKKNHGHHRRG